MLNLPFSTSLPKPKGHYLVSLSTPFGIMQHTSFSLADPHFGYSTDDNARALIAVNFWRKQETRSLANTSHRLFAEIEERFLKFLKFMQAEDGRFYCYLTFDLKRKQLGLGDWFGRALFALSFIVNRSERFDKPALSIVWRSLPLILAKANTANNQQLPAGGRKLEAGFNLRTRAYLLLAFYYLLKQGEALKKEPHNSTLPKSTLAHGILKKGEVERIQRLIRSWGKDFLERLRKHEEGRWVWPEAKITYDNGKIIQAYFLLGQLLEKEKFIREGRRILDFYLAKTMRKGYFQAPGNAHGQFWSKGEPMPTHDEQPIEAYSLISALVTASLVTGEKNYLGNAKRVYQWFFGKNRLGINLVEEKSGAVHDGLRRKDINDNKGAESYLSLTFAYFALKHLIHL